ncbi:MAG TPA: chromosome segregation protein SMC [Deltaproteobacteria bacterium]|nr:chromosome segregation protein SMC [Deltaproteobacteria bacterium]HQB38835.1 chromosome segregation protein SMC [Deltaproteobacteria bacterium]
MKIKRLEINGFKSFADKVVLDFQQGVTGVVGPNGCGKSNVVDAIRWCMGEQSAKNLRGKSMEDVIFAGSETRKPLGMAEVTLVFSTEDGRAPARYLEFSEVQLTRRLYRDGDSDYLINKTPCRLMDITELFMDTGVGTKAYSIIEQGKIGMILHSRPEERRFLIEEAAGVTKFKARKQLALKKIEATRQNLMRLSDVLGEIRRQLSALQRQARKAEKFRELRDELRGIELLFSASEYRALQQQRQQAEEELSSLDDRIRKAFAAATLGESELERARLELLEAEKVLNTAQEEIYRVRSESAAAESALEFQRKEQTALSGRVARLESEVSELVLRLKDCLEQRTALEIRRDASSGDVLARQAELLEQEQALAADQQAEAELNRMLEARRKQLFSVISELAQSKNRLETARKRLSGLAERLERSRREGVQLGERLELTRRRVVELETEEAEERRQYEGLNGERAALRLQEDGLKERLPELEKNWQHRRDELNRTSSRLASLVELENSFAGYGQGVRSLMQSSELRSIFRGVLADEVSVAEEFEAALEAALGECLQGVLCADAADSVRAIAHLKQGNAGRALLALPLDTATAPAEAPEGTLALAGLVRVEGVYGGLVQLLLADVIVADGLEQALAFSRRFPGLRFVTRDGDMAYAGGMVSGGSAEQVRKGLVHKKREIRDLEGLVAGLEKDVSVLGAERDSLRQLSQELAESIRVVGTRLHQSELRLSGLARDRQQAADEVGRIEERLAMQTLDEANLDEERVALEAEAGQATQRIDETSAAERDLEQALEGLKSGLEEKRSLLSEARERVTVIRVQVATLREQHDSCLRGIKELERQQQDLERRIASDREQLESGSQELARLCEAIVAGSELLEGLALRQSRSEERLATVRQCYDAAAVQLTEREHAARQARDESAAVRQSHADLNLRFSTLNMQAEHLERGMQERSRIPMKEALARLEQSDFSEVSARGRQAELQRLLDEMGEVNLMAIDECAGMEERFNFLSAQKDDLEESMRGLQQAIQKINRTTRQRFLETYNQVNAKFQEVFPRLFCGGQAELRLTNEEDLLETGIDIIVQPPGKKLQNVTLLSGGEKALTAVALIFSIFLIKPTPFCLLDEVDAPLDDANIGRFNEMVREMSAISQFIVITHNKTTMQVADMLYGITMEAPGTSKMVSVRLH